MLGSFLLSAPRSRGDCMARRCTADRLNSVAILCAPCCVWAWLTF